jgi:peptidoglycan/LPS O-acetylase OafA/YrhL
MSLRFPAPSDGSAPPATAAHPGTAAPEPAAAGSAEPPPAAPAARREPVRLRALDGLRLVAALMVCAYHFVDRGGSAFGRPMQHVFPHLMRPCSYGPLGVHYFFVISGFVICMSGWGRSVKDFAVSRIIRLYPAYWAAIALVAVIFPIVGYATVSRTDLLTNLTMLQTPAGAQRVLGVSWTLWAELRFYLLFALTVLWRGATRQRVLVFCAVWTVGALYADSSGQPFLKLALMPDYAPFFVGGIGLYLIHRFGHDAMAWGVVATGFLLGQHYAVREMVAPPSMHVFYHRSPTIVIALVAFGFAAVALATVVPWTARVNWRWLTTAGVLTYPFYLVHETIGRVVTDELVRRTTLPDSAVLAIAVVSMLVLAWLVHRLVERPFAPRLKRLLVRQLSGPGSPRPAR